MNMRDDDRLKIERLMFYKEDIELIEKVLGMFLQKSQAKCTLLIDKEGHLITMHGDVPRAEADMDSICTLLAGTFAATQQWARLLGEEEFTVLFHQGKKDSIQVTLVEDRTLLAVIFDERTSLGLVRLMCNEVSKKLSKVFEDAAAKQSTLGHQPAALEEGFNDFARKKLEEIFPDA